MRFIRSVLFAVLLLIISTFLALVLSVISSQSPSAAAACVGVLAAFGVAGGILWAHRTRRSIRNAFTISKEFNQFADEQARNAMAPHIIEARQQARTALSQLNYLYLVMFSLGTIRLLVALIKWLAK